MKRILAEQEMLETKMEKNGANDGGGGVVIGCGLSPT